MVVLPSPNDCCGAIITHYIFVVHIFELTYILIFADVVYCNALVFHVRLSLTVGE